VVVPAVRDRSEDIPLLVKHYTVQMANPQIDTNMVEFTEDAMALLTSYHWSGNLTELFEVISKIVSTSEARLITAQQLPLRLSELKSWPSLDEYLVGQKSKYCDMVLHACHGDKAAAARVLKIETSQLD
jgi:two-component system, NtrC family, response regulator HydG